MRINLLILLICILLVETLYGQHTMEQLHHHEIDDDQISMTFSLGFSEKVSIVDQMLFVENNSLVRDLIIEIDDLKNIWASGVEISVPGSDVIVKEFDFLGKNLKRNTAIYMVSLMIPGSVSPGQYKIMVCMHNGQRSYAVNHMVVKGDNEDLIDTLYLSQMD